jgi:hypothetical protein
VKLEEALDTCTRSAKHHTKKVLPFEPAGGQSSEKSATSEANTKSKVDAFIMSGLGTPAANIKDPTKGTLGDQDLMRVLTNVANQISDDLVMYVLSYPKPAAIPDSTNAEQQATGSETGKVEGVPLPTTSAAASSIPSAAADAKARVDGFLGAGQTTSNSGKTEFYQ